MTGSKDRPRAFGLTAAAAPAAPAMVVSPAAAPGRRAFGIQHQPGAAPAGPVPIGPVDWYAGVGSRETPAESLEHMRRLAMELAGDGFGLRSGAAPGADSAFEQGCDDAQGAKAIFLPWAGFQKRQADAGTHVLPRNSPAMEIAAKLHPAWPYLKPYARLLHSRNVMQICGFSLDEPARFALLWTKDGAQAGAETSQATGGTGMAIRIASLYGVPVINMNRAGWEDRLLDIRAACQSERAGRADPGARAEAIEPAPAHRGG